METVGLVVSAAFFLELGNELIKRRKQCAAKAAMSRFKANFGASPNTVHIIWCKIVNAMEIPAGGKHVHLLWALMFMKLYCADSVMASLVGGVHEQTFRKWSWWFIDAISYLQYSTILWRNRFEGDIGNVALVSVDGTYFQIYQWMPFWKGWYSHKFKGPGVRYEVGLCIQTGKIIWIHGPFPCGRWPDLKIFRSAMKHQLSVGEKVVADKGYRGEPNHIVTPTGERSEPEQRVRGRHGTVNRRFKQFGIMHRVFRHSVLKHQSAFGAVAVVTEVSIENGEPLFGVDYSP